MQLDFQIDLADECIRKRGDPYLNDEALSPRNDKNSTASQNSTFRALEEIESDSFEQNFPFARNWAELEISNHEQFNELLS